MSFSSWPTPTIKSLCATLLFVESEINTQDIRRLIRVLRISVEEVWDACWVAWGCLAFVLSGWDQYFLGLRGPSPKLYLLARLIIWHLRHPFKRNADGIKVVLYLPNMSFSLCPACTIKRPCATLWLGGEPNKYPIYTEIFMWTIYVIPILSTLPQTTNSYLLSWNILGSDDFFTNSQKNGAFTSHHNIIIEVSRLNNNEDIRKN